MYINYTTNIVNENTLFTTFLNDVGDFEAVCEVTCNLVLTCAVTSIDFFNGTTISKKAFFLYTTFTFEQHETKFRIRKFI